MLQRARWPKRTPPTLNPAKLDGALYRLGNETEREREREAGKAIWRQWLLSRMDMIVLLNNDRENKRERWTQDAIEHSVCLRELMEP